VTRVRYGKRDPEGEWKSWALAIVLSALLALVLVKALG